MNFLTDNFYVIQSKVPIEENDNMLLRLMNFNIDDEAYDKLLEDSYLKFKHSRFADFNVSPEGFSDFKEKTSLIGSDMLDEFTDTIYTYSAIKKNEIMNRKLLDLMNSTKEEKILAFDNLMKKVSEVLSKKPKTRRCVINFASSFKEYSLSELDPAYDSDISCLLNIQYMEKKVNINFRAMDLKDESFVDIVLLWKWFIKPVYGNKKIELNIYSNTTQNTPYLNKLITKLVALHYKTE